MNKISTVDEIRNKIESKRYDYFTFPVLEITIKYRRPDLLKLSIDNSLPQAIAEAVISSYKDSMSGVTMDEQKKKALEEKFEADEDLLKEIVAKGYALLSALCESHKFADVPESDLDCVPVPLISWKDVPEEDAMAFLLSLINKAQVVEAAGG